jgi:hypothetical protein
MTAVFLFHTSSAAFRADKVLNEAQIAARLIPTPRQFSSDCGISLKVDWSHVDSARVLLESRGVEYAAVHQMSG